MKPLFPVLVILAMMPSRLRPGLFASKIAAPPETCGHAMDVPLKDVEPVFELADVEGCCFLAPRFLLHLPWML